MRMGMLVPALLLTSCTTMRWAKPGATQEDFLKDRYTCAQASQTRRATAAASAYGANYSNDVYISCSGIISCMNAKGYIRDDDNGTLTAPKGNVIKCY